MSRTRRGTSAALAALALALAVPGLAAAATKPGVSTGGASKVTITTATLNGKVNPHGGGDDLLLPVRHHAGLRLAHARRRAPAPAPRRSAPPRRSPAWARTRSTTTASSPATASGTTVGGDRTFTTPKQPLGLALAATPNPVAFGAPSTLAGTLSGTGNAGRPIRLQQKPFPFTAAFTNVGNVQLTNAQGAFSFALLSVPLTTQYRVLVTDKTSVVSPILTVSVSVVVGTKTTRTHVHRGGHVHFSGTIKPNVPNVPVAIQKLNAKKHWVTISGTITRDGRHLLQDDPHQARRELPRLRGRQRRHLRARGRAQGPHPH